MSAKTVKLLNLDDLATTERNIVIKGKKYTVLDMTVENFIQSSKLAEQMEKSEDNSAVSHFELAVGTLKRQIADIEESVLRSLSIEQLAALLKFARGEMDEQVKGEAGEVSKGNADAPLKA